MRGATRWGLALCAALGLALRPRMSGAQQNSVWAQSRAEDLWVALVTFGPDLSMLCRKRRSHEADYFQDTMPVLRSSGWQVGQKKVSCP